MPKSALRITMISINITGRLENHTVVTTPCGKWLIMVVNIGSGCIDTSQKPREDSSHIIRIVKPLTIDVEICKTCLHWNTDLFTCLSLCDQ